MEANRGWPWRVVSTQHPTPAQWEQAAKLRSLDPLTVAAGVERCDLTGDYHTWVSLYGSDLCSWYVGPEKVIAHALLLEITLVLQHWHGTDHDNISIAALMHTCAVLSTSHDAALPDNQVRDILEAIALRARAQQN